MSDEIEEPQPSGNEELRLSPGDVSVGVVTFIGASVIDLIGHYGIGGMLVGSMATVLATGFGDEIILASKEVIALSRQVFFFLSVRQERQQLPPARKGERQALPRVQEAKPTMMLPEEELIDWEEEAMGNLITDEEMFDSYPLFPSCPADQQLRLGRVAGVSKRFDPPINKLLGKGMIIAGAQESGKSNLTGLCATFAGRCYMPVVVIDLKGEFYPLIETVPNGIRAGHPSFADEAGEGYFSLTEETAPEFAALVMEGGFQAIIHIPSYSDGDEVALVVAATLNALMDWSQHQQEDERIPCLVETDEAHNFVPQNQSRSALRMHSDSFNMLQSAYSRMCNTGRSYGYTMVMATQRIANIAKWAIANLQIKVIMRHAEKNDLDRCEEEVGADIADRNVVKALPQGTGIVVGLTPGPVTVKFDKQPARHVSNTPSIERAHQRFRNRQNRAPMPQPMQPNRYRTPITPIRGYRHSAPLQREYEPLEELVPNPTRRLPDPPVTSRPPRDKNRETIETWERLVEQGKANKRNFASAMSINESKAYVILDKLQKAGLIEWERRKNA